MGWQADRLTDRQTDRQIDRLTCRQADRQTASQLVGMDISTNELGQRTYWPLRFHPVIPSLLTQVRKQIHNCFVYFVTAAGEALVAADKGIWDNYCVKKQILHSWYAVPWIKNVCLRVSFSCESTKSFFTATHQAVKRSTLPTHQAIEQSKLPIHQLVAFCIATKLCDSPH